MSCATTTVSATLLSQGDYTPAEPLALVESSTIPGIIPQTNDPLLGVVIILAIVCACALIGICVAWYRLTTTKQSQDARYCSMSPYGYTQSNRSKHQSNRFKKYLGIAGIIAIQIIIVISIYLAIT